MATVIEARETGLVADVPYPITSDIYGQMVESGLIPVDRLVYLWGGRLFEKMAKTKAHAGTHAGLITALARRLPADMFIAAENPVRLDPVHVPLPDVVVARGRAVELYQSRYPDGRDIVLIAEVAVTSRAQDLGDRLSRYALTLPDAIYIVADVKNRKLLVHRGPRAIPETDRGEYTEVETVGPGQMLRLTIGGVALEPIPFEDVMR